MLNSFNFQIVIVAIGIIIFFYLLKVPKITYILAILSTEISFVVPSIIFSLSGFQIGFSFYNILLFIVLVNLLLYILLGKHLMDQKYPIVVKSFIKTIVLWWCIVTFSTIITPLINGGFAPYYAESIKRVLDWTLGIMALLVGLKFFSWKEKDLKIYVNILIIFTVIISIIALEKKNLLFTSNYFKMSGWQAYSLWRGTAKNEMPEILGFVALLSISIGIQVKYLGRKMFYIISAVILILALLPFFSRETFITLLMGILTLLFISRKHLIKRIILIGTVVGIIVILSQEQIGSYLTWTIKNLSTNPNIATGGRIARWIEAIKIGYHYPLTGVGFWGFRYFSSGLSVAAHNAFLESLAISGLPGFFIFLIVLYQLHRTLRVALSLSKGFTRSACAGLLSAFIGYAVSGLVSDHFFTFPIYNILFWGTFAIIVGTIYNKVRRETGTNSLKQGKER